MKVLLIILVIAAIVWFAFFRKENKEPVQPQEESVKSEVQSVIDYGIGATQLRAKQRATEKIQTINDQHNRDLENALQ